MVDSALRQLRELVAAGFISEDEFQERSSQISADYAFTRTSSFDVDTPYAKAPSPSSFTLENSHIASHQAAIDFENVLPNEYDHRPSEESISASTTRGKSARAIRLFVSSTLKDMEAEREQLVKRVFPEIRRVCIERGVSFVDIGIKAECHFSN